MVTFQKKSQVWCTLHRKSNSYTRNGEEVPRWYHSLLIILRAYRLEVHTSSPELSQGSQSHVALRGSALLPTALVGDPVSLEINWVHPLSASYTQ